MKYMILFFPVTAAVGLGVFLAAGCTGTGSGSVIVPTATIVVDGNRSDWQNLKALTSDPVGDADGPNGCDVEAIYVATDSQNVYFRIDVANGTPSRGLTYMVSLSREDSEWNYGDIYVVFDVGNDRCSAFRAGAEDGIPIASGKAAVSGSTIEMSVPLRSPVLPASAYISSTTGTPTIDWIDYIAEGGLLSVFRQ